jgi:serine protease Do
MNLLKKILIVLISIILISATVYLMVISYQNQQSKRPLSSAEEKLPAAPPETSRDTITLPLPENDSLELSIPPTQVPAESLNWRQLPKKERQVSGDSFPRGNPNATFITAAERILPAVVTVQSEMTVSQIPQDENHKFFWEKQGEEDPEFFQQGTGSGIIITEDGYILTNYHVIENASSFNIILYDRREYQAQFVGGDPNTDVGLIKITGNNLPIAYIGNSDSIKIGEWVMAVGSPLNFSSTITAGIISALGRNIRIIDSEYGVENFIQTDAVINPGNSGGALINLNGEVIGLNTAIATRTGLYQGYGFAIPINLATKIVNDILTFGEVRRGLLGVSISEVNSRVAKGVGLPRPTGVFIQSLQPGKAADQAGLHPGDVILSVDGTEVISVNDLQIRIASKNPGQKVILKVWRDLQEITFQVKLGQAPIQQSMNANNNQRKKLQKNLGMEIRDLTNMEQKTFDLQSGVFIDNVKAGSPANKGGIFPGYVIHRFNDQEISSKKDFETKLHKLKPGEVVKLTCRPPGFRDTSDDRILFVEVDE